MSFYDESSCRHANVGIPQEEIKHEAFLKVIRYSDDHDTFVISAIDLNTKMAKYLPDDVHPYGFTHMKEIMI